MSASLRDACGTHTHKHTHTYTYTHAHTHKHTHTHTFSLTYPVVKVVKIEACKQVIEMRVEASRHNFFEHNDEEADTLHHVFSLNHLVYIYMFVYT